MTFSHMPTAKSCTWCKRPLFYLTRPAPSLGGLRSSLMLTGVYCKHCDVPHSPVGCETCNPNGLSIR